MRRTYHRTMVRTHRMRLAGFLGGLVVTPLLNWSCLRHAVPQADTLLGVAASSGVMLALYVAWVTDTTSEGQPIFWERHEAQNCRTQVLCRCAQYDLKNVLLSWAALGIVPTMWLTMYLARNVPFSWPIWLPLVAEFAALVGAVGYALHRPSLESS